MSEQLKSLKLQTDEWELVKYLLILTYPFAIKGYTICAEIHTSINLMWDTYNSLFQHLDDEKETLENNPSFHWSTLIHEINAAYKSFRNALSKLRNTWVTITILAAFSILAIKQQHTIVIRGVPYLQPNRSKTFLMCKGPGGQYGPGTSGNRQCAGVGPEGYY